LTWLLQRGVYAGLLIASLLRLSARVNQLVVSVQWRHAFGAGFFLPFL
jgi:hypothetical protein